MTARSAITRSLERLVRGEAKYFIVSKDGSVKESWKGEPPLLMSGSFNPLHDGHLKMASVAEQKSSRNILFELTINNADKGKIDEQELYKRIEQFHGRHAVTITTCRLFVDKLNTFPGSYMLVGYDTIIRILDPKYYPDSSVDAILEAFDKLNSKFIVAGRTGGGKFQTMSLSMVPIRFQHLFVILSEDDFRLDISSTELRAAEGKSCL